MRPWSPRSCHPTPAPHTPDFPPTDRRQAPPAARCACDSNRTPPYVTRPVHTHEPIQVGRVQAVPAHRGPDCPTRLPTPPPPESSDGVCVPALPASANPPPPPARPPPPPPPTATRTATSARGTTRAHPASGSTRCGMRRPPLPLPPPRRVAVAGRGRGAARRAALPSLLRPPAAITTPGCRRRPRLPPPPPPATTPSWPHQ